MAKGPLFNRDAGGFPLSLQMTLPSNGQGPLFSDGAAGPMPAPNATPFTPAQPPENDPSGQTQSSLMRRAYAAAARAATKVRNGVVKLNNFDKAHPWVLPLTVGAGVVAAMVTTGTYTPNNSGLAAAEMVVTGGFVGGAARLGVSLFRPGHKVRKIAAAAVMVVGFATIMPNLAPFLVSRGMKPTDPYARMIQHTSNMLGLSTPPHEAVAETNKILTVNPGQMLVGYTDMFKADNVTPLPWKQENKKKFQGGQQFRILGKQHHNDPASNLTTTETLLQPIDDARNPAIDPKTNKPYPVISADPISGTFTISANEDPTRNRLAAKGAQPALLPV